MFLLNVAFGIIIMRADRKYDGDSIVDGRAAYFENLIVSLATPLSVNQRQKNTSMNEMCTSCGGLEMDG